MDVKAFRHFFLSVLLIALPRIASAQISTTVIGTDPLTNQQFECVRFSDPSLNSVTITSVDSGEEKSVEISSAKSIVKKHLKAALRKLNKAVDQRNDLITERNSLLRTQLITPNRLKRLVNVNKRLKKLKARIATLKGQRGLLRELGKAVDGCNDSTIPQQGGLSLYQGTFTDPLGVRFYTGIAIQLSEAPPTSKQTLCAKVTGGSTKIDFMSGLFPPEAPTITPVTIVQNPCVATVSNSNECGGRLEGYFGLFFGNGGFQTPGNCASGQPTFECSLEESVDVLTSRLGEMSIEVVKFTATSGDC